MNRVWSVHPGWFLAWIVDIILVFYLWAIADGQGALAFFLALGFGFAAILTLVLLLSPFDDTMSYFVKCACCGKYDRWQSRDQFRKAAMEIAKSEIVYVTFECDHCGANSTETVKKSSIGVRYQKAAAYNKAQAIRRGHLKTIIEEEEKAQ